jgi:acetate kinase
MYCLMVDPMPRQWSLALTDSESGKVLSQLDAPSPAGGDDTSPLERALKKIFLKRDVHPGSSRLDSQVKEVHYRLTNGGGIQSSPAVVNETLLMKLRVASAKAPFHVPPLLNSIAILRKIFPKAVHKVYSETVFFNQLPQARRVYAIPAEISSKLKINRNGLHGIFHKHASEIASGPAVISWCLDRRISVCGMAEGVPQMISGGVTPLEGIIGETVCGDIDPGIILYLMEKEKISTMKMDHLLKEESGFRALTGMDLDLAGVFGKRSSSNKCSLALEMLEYQILKYTGRIFALMDGFTDLVIGGCYAEPVFPYVYQLLKNMSFAGIQLKPLSGVKRDKITVLSADDSKVKVTLTREGFLELMR